MNRRDFLRTLVSVVALPSIPLSAAASVASVRSRWKVVGTVTGRTVSAGVLNQQFLQKRHLAKMWMFAKNYGGGKERFVKNLERIDAEPVKLYNNYKKLFVTNFKEIEMLALERIRNG